MAGIPCALLLAAAAIQPNIPRTWEDAAVAGFEVPLADPRFSPVHISEAEYYRLPERVIYKSYPVYHPDREPAGYTEWLKTREPEIAFDAAHLKTRADFIAAGEVVFNAPTTYGPLFFSAANLRDRAFYEQTGMPVAKDGTVPFARWVVRQRGQVELGSMGCNTCHTRVLPDGTIVPGAQGNNPGDRQGALLLRQAAKTGDPTQVLERARRFARELELPWLPDDPNRLARTLSLDELVAAGEAIPAGVTARSNTSIFLPPQIPDLIGVEQRRYLDHTGLVRHRSIGDLMRYSTLVQDVFALDRYGDQPSPKPAGGGHQARYSDAQLYALSLYIYTLRPPRNPNPFDDAARRGKKIFETAGCSGCHTPPLYTNNQLIPAAQAGTDPRYTLQTHKGTGYYKVPSLKGVWYRGPFGHNGSVATLEDWFDPARVKDDYVPTGYKGYDGNARGVKGHEFGLHLPPVDRQSLIAFLRTL